MRFRRLAGLGIGLACAAGPAWAQTQDGAEPSGSEEVVVTSTKRSKVVQDVAISMNVFNGNQLKELGVSDFKELSAQIPGVTFFQTPTIPALQMRGFSTPAANPAFDQTVALYTDGIFAGRARQFQAPFFDLARIEVLRGPQGALLGKNTSAGAISIVSANPSDELEAGLDATYLFEREGVDATAYVSGPVSETLKARVALRYYKTTEGWLHNTALDVGDPKSDVLQGRVTLEWTPTEHITVLTKVEYSDYEEIGRPSANFPGTVPIEDVLDYERDVGLIFGERDGTTLKPLLISNTATFDLGDLTLVSVTGYSQFESTSIAGGGATTPEVFATTLFEDYDQTSQEFRLLSPTGQTIEWIVGAYFDTSNYEAVNLPRYNLLGGRVNGQGRSVFLQDGTSYSVFGTATWNATEELRAIVGMRWTRIEKEGDFRLTQDFGPPFGYVPGTDLDDKIKESHFDPAVTVEYDITDDIMAYASWSKGSKGGAFQGANRTVTAATFALEPEEAKNIEIGFKSTWDDWLTLNVAAYQLTVKNLQTGQYVGTPPTLINVNAGEARTRGLEWTATIRASDELTISTVGTFMEAEYLDYPGAACTYEQLQQGCINGTINAKGRDFAGVSKWSGSVTADYRTPISDELELTLFAQANFRTRFNVDANVQNPFFGEQEGYTKLNARAAIGAIDGSWAVALVGQNLTDEITSNAIFGWGPPFVASQTAVAQVDPGRSVGLQLTMKY